MSDSTEILSFTDAAIAKFKEILSEENMSDAYLRVAAEPTPEGRMSYRFGVDTAMDAEDHLVDVGFKAVVDTNSAQYIRGASIDYTDTLQRSGFTVTNPNVQGCGAGDKCCGGACGGG